MCYIIIESTPQKILNNLLKKQTPNKILMINRNKFEYNIQTLQKNIYISLTTKNKLLYEPQYQINYNKRKYVNYLIIHKLLQQVLSFWSYTLYTIIFKYLSFQTVFYFKCISI